MPVNLNDPRIAPALRFIADELDAGKLLVEYFGVQRGYAQAPGTGYDPASMEPTGEKSLSLSYRDIQQAHEFNTKGMVAPILRTLDWDGKGNP